MNSQNPDPKSPWGQPAPYGQNQRRIPPTDPYGQPRRHPTQKPAPDAEPTEDTFWEKLNGWRLGISIEMEPIIRALVCLLLISFFSLLQTTLFTRFRPFGAVPDLLLSLVVAIAMTAREKWGAVCGLAAAFIIESLGGATVTILSILYMPTGYIIGLLSVYYFRDGAAVRAMYTGVTAAARSLFTMVILFMSTSNVSIPSALVHAAIPEFFATVLFAFLPHLAVKYAFRLTEGKKE